MDRIRHYGKQGKLLEEAIEKAVADTKVEGLLKEYLTRKEFITMITKILTIEEEIDLFRKEEREEGKKEGRNEGAIEIARKLASTGMDIEQIIKITGLSEEDIRKFHN